MFSLVLRSGRPLAAFDVDVEHVRVVCVYPFPLARSHREPLHNDQLVAVNYVAEKTSEGMQVRPEPRPPMPGYLADAVQRSYARYTPEETE